MKTANYDISPDRSAVRLNTAYVVCSVVINNENRAYGVRHKTMFDYK